LLTFQLFRDWLKDAEFVNIKLISVTLLTSHLPIFPLKLGHLEKVLDKLVVVIIGALNAVHVKLMQPKNVSLSVISKLPVFETFNIFNLSPILAKENPLIPLPDIEILLVPAPAE
jgi:hypothetical protein